MAVRTLLVSLIAVVGLASPARAQRPWVEAKGPHVTVLSDAGAGRATELAWQFEQVREAIARVFPWVRVDGERPLVVMAARNEASMRTLAPKYWENGGDGGRLASVSQMGRDRSYIAVRADAKVEDREGINPYQAAYWSFGAQALRDTSSGLPAWLVRGMASVISNILVRDKEIQVGRILANHLTTLNTRPRLSLRDVVSVVATDDKRFDQDGFLAVIDAHAWAFVHFLAWADRGANAGLLDRYVAGVIAGADPTTSLASTLGDVSRFENAFNVYVNRNLFLYTSLATSAKLARDGFTTRELPAAESAVMRGAMLAAMSRKAEARASVDDARKAAGFDVGDEALALLADYAGDDNELHDRLEKALSQPYASWYVPYRLAMLLPTTQGSTQLERIETLLTQATTLNPSADTAWAYLGEIKAALGRGEASLAPVEKAVAMAPASSAHRVSYGRVLRRLGRRQEALKFAGMARALARTVGERAEAQGLLGELAKELASPAPEVEARGPAAVPGSSTGAGAPAGDATGRRATALRPRGAGVDIGGLVDDCNADNATCAGAFPVIAAACDAATSRSLVACRFAGYVLDVGLGMSPDPAKGAAFYTRGCGGGDQPSCWRLALLQAQGRGVPKDAAAALRVLDPACTGGAQEACLRLGVSLASSGVVADMARAKAVLKTSCDTGLEASCQALKQLPQ